MPPKTLQCKDCKKEFLFEEGEQAVFAKNNFADPIRCKPCRDIKKQSRPKQDQQYG